MRTLADEPDNFYTHWNRTLIPDIWKGYTMRIQTILWTAMLFIAGGICHAQTVAAPYEVGTWHGFRQAAVTYTFDDNTPNQFDQAIPIFNEFNFNLTLFIVTDPAWEWAADWTVLQNAAAQGHEVASHTVTHTTFAGMADEAQDMELKNSKATIEANIPGYHCITMAYPYCATGRQSICEQYYIAGRICSGSIEKSTPRNFMGISSIICGTEGSVQTCDHFISRAKQAANANGWCVYLLHGVDDDGGWSPVPSETLRETLEYLSAHQDSFWVQTFGNVTRYIKERDAVSVEETSVEDAVITLAVTDTLADSIYNVPVTLRRPLPEGWPFATVTQNGQPVEVTTQRIEGVQHILFNVIPDQGDVVITKNNTTHVQSNKNITPGSHSLLYNYPNPFNPSTTISFDLNKSSEVTLEVFDNIGRTVDRLVHDKLPAGTHSVVFRGGALPSGIYYYQLKTTELALQRKMILLK